MSSTESVTYVYKAIIEQTVLGLGEIFDDNGVDRKILDDLSLVCSAYAACVVLDVLVAALSRADVVTRTSQSCSCVLCALVSPVKFCFRADVAGSPPQCPCVCRGRTAHAHHRKW